MNASKWDGHIELGSYALIGEAGASPTMEKKDDSLTMALTFVEDRKGESLQATTCFRWRLNSS